MQERMLEGRRILVVEDEYLLADELSTELGYAGAAVIGPVATVDQALNLLAGDTPDGAILDINLGEETVFPVADAMVRRGLPFVFTTGYDRATLPLRFADIPTCEKPFTVSRITSAMRRALPG